MFKKSNKFFFFNKHKFSFEICVIFLCVVPNPVTGLCVCHTVVLRCCATGFCWVCIDVAANHYKLRSLKQHTLINFYL